MANIKDETGNRYTRLVVLHIDDSHKVGARWVCQCDCGNTISVLGASLRSGNTRSCGCLRKEALCKRHAAKRQQAAECRARALESVGLKPTDYQTTDEYRATLDSLTEGQ